MTPQQASRDLPSHSSRVTETLLGQCQGRVQLPDRAAGDRRAAELGVLGETRVSDASPWPKEGGAAPGSVQREHSRKGQAVPVE